MTAASPLPLVTTSTDLAGFDGVEALVQGTYRAVPRPVRGSDQGRPLDRAVVVLDDGARVYLEPLDEPTSIRPDDERERLEGRWIAVRGIVHEYMPSRGQAPLSPCVHHIDLLEVADAAGTDDNDNDDDDPEVTG